MKDSDELRTKFSKIIGSYGVPVQQRQKCIDELLQAEAHYQPQAVGDELALAKRLGIVWRPATKQFLLEVKRPSDDQWHIHDITHVVQGMQQLLTERQHPND
jgi:hypothetical protein